MSLYVCSSCTDTIPLNKPRIHCAVCSNHYNLCANCYVLGRYTTSHSQDHATMLHEKSGTVPKPPAIPPRPPLPPRPTSNTPVSAASQTNSPPSYTSIPRKPTQVASQPQVRSPTQTSPVEAARAEPIHDKNTTSEAPRGWKPLFEGCAPTATALTFFNTIFDCLDTAKTGLLSPEQYSAFCDVQGYLPHEDVWKRSNKAQFGSNGEDLADYELRTVYENFALEHVLRPRQSAPNNDMADMINSMSSRLTHMMASQLSSSINIPSISGGQMPMLTRKGFVDITTLETLGVPPIGWMRINRMAKYYGVWTELGDCPREMLPEQPPKELTDRIARVWEYSQRQAAQRIESAKVEMALRADGRQHATDLTSDTRYIYRYY